MCCGPCGIFFPVLSPWQKGIDAEKALSTANSAVTMVDTAFDTVKPFIPASPAVSIVDKLIDWAKVGTASAERLYKTSKIQSDERKSEATDFILNALKVAGISVTPEIQKMIDGAVEGAVEVMPKTHSAENNIRYQNSGTDSTQGTAAPSDSTAAAQGTADQQSTPAAVDSSSGTTAAVTATAPATDQQTAPAAAADPADTSATAGTGTADALTAAAKALHESADMLSNAAIAINGTTAQADTAAAAAPQA